MSGPSGDRTHISLAYEASAFTNLATGPSELNVLSGEMLSHWYIKTDSYLQPLEWCRSPPFSSLLQGWDSNPRPPVYTTGEASLSIVCNFHFV